jgi:hypothetical protein
LPVELIFRIRVKPLARKYISSVYRKIMALIRHPVSMRGAYRDRHDARGGMWWTRARRQTNDAGADDKSVWSRSPDAEIKLAD